MNHTKNFLAATALALAAVAASAAPVSYTFNGITEERHPLALVPLSGSFSFEGVAANYTGEVALTAFSLDFYGEHYDLLDADAPAMAWFDNGLFLGVEFNDFNDTSRYSVGLTAGIFDPLDAFFSYGAEGGVQGYGSLNFEPNRVPLPGTAGLALAAFMGLAVMRRRVGR